jgi:hypothetical protein
LDRKTCFKHPHPANPRKSQQANVLWGTTFLPSCGGNLAKIAVTTLVRDAVAYLRRERDVVQLSILAITRIVHFQDVVDEIAAKNREAATQKTAT